VFRRKIELAVPQWTGLPAVYNERPVIRSPAHWNGNVTPRGLL